VGFHVPFEIKFGNNRLKKTTLHCSVGYSLICKAQCTSFVLYKTTMAKVCGMLQNCSVSINGSAFVPIYYFDFITLHIKKF